MNQFPSRHTNHSLESRSELFFKNYLPIEWIVDKPTDYGVDLKIDIVNNQQVIGQNFSVQLKAHESVLAGKPIIVTLERTTINLYLARLEPVLLVCYIANHNEAYYAWFTERTVDLTKSNKTFSIRLDPLNKISTLNWEIVSSYVNQIFSKRSLLYGFPEINFSNMGEGEKSASGFYLKKDYETALFLFKQMQRDNPQSYWLNSIALCHYGLYQYKEALAAINQALEQNNLDSYRINKASILAEYGIDIGNKAMVLEAKEIFENEIKKLDNQNQHFNYANTLSWLGENEAAKNHYRKSLKLNPNYAEAWKNLGEIYSRTDNSKKALECYNKALLINPKLPQALISKGITLIKKFRKYEEGLVFLNDTLNIDPSLFLKYNSGYFWFAYAYFKLGNKKLGLDYVTKGLNQYPGDPYLLNLKRDYFRDNWLVNPKIINEAKSFFLYRLEVEPEDALSLECLCRIYLHEKDRRKAISLIKKHTLLLKKSDYTDCMNASFIIEPFLNSLFNYHNYCCFRHEHPLERELNAAVSPIFYFEFCELLGLKIFHESLEFLKKHRNEKNFERELIDFQFQLIEDFYPLSAPYVITVPRDETKILGEQLTNAIFHIPILAFKEIAKINGYLTNRYNLNRKKVGSAINNSIEIEINKKIVLLCLEKIQEYHKIFPEE